MYTYFTSYCDLHKQGKLAEVEHKDLSNVNSPVCIKCGDYAKLYYVKA